MSPTYWKRRKAKRLERSRKGVAARLAKHAVGHAGEPVRVDRVVEITIRDSHRPMTVIRLEREDQGEKWGRWRSESGRPESLGAVSTYCDRGGHDDSARGIGTACLGPTGVGKLIGKYLE